MNFFVKSLTVLLVLTVNFYTYGQRQILGKVVDSQTKKPINEAKITVVGKDSVWTTNIQGYFQISLDTARYLHISSPGYVTGQIMVPSQDKFQIPLLKAETAQYQGGVNDLYKFLSRNVKYPELARRNYVQGLMYVCFDIDTLGTLQKITVLKDIGGDCGKELIRLIASIPEQWIPGNSTTRFILPVSFYLGGLEHKRKKEAAIVLPEGVLMEELSIVAHGISSVSYPVR